MKIKSIYFTGPVIEDIKIEPYLSGFIITSKSPIHDFTSEAVDTELDRLEDDLRYYQDDED